MPIKILMPALSPTMTEGNLAKWLKKEGDKVEAGEVLAEIETDKAVMEVEAVDEGTLGKIVVQGGAEGVKVNSVIGLLLEEGEDKAELDKVKIEEPAAAAPQEEPQKEEVKAAPAPEPAVAAPTPTPIPLLTAAPAPAPAATTTGGRIMASPLAKRIAAERNINLALVQGSGAGGRIVVKDLDRAPSGGVMIAPQQTQELVPHTLMRKTIAKRLVEAKQTIPHFYLTVECDMTALMKFRADYNEMKAPLKISVNDLLVKACAVAFQKVPEANAIWTDEGIIRYSQPDIGVAVSIPGGLITPIVRSVAHKQLEVISAEIKDYAGRAKEGKLQPEEYTGGSFTLSNLGMYGIQEFSAIINPPQSMILAVGGAFDVPVVRDGKVTTTKTMKATLSVDHRVVDGALGSDYLAAFKKAVESPLMLVV